MKPILYDADRTSFPASVDNGLGVLADAMSCKVTQELNGQYELELHYPVEGIHYEEIALRAILRATVGPDGKLQPFRVYRIVPSMNGTAAIYARHIAYDLGGYVVSPFTAADAPSAVAGIKSHALPAGMPFTLGTDKTTVATLSVMVPTSAWGLLGGQRGSLLDVYGGEYEFDEWMVRLLTRRGADRGVSVRYGKNLTDLTQDANCANCYTGVVPYWRGNDVTVTAAPVYAEGDYGYVRLMPLDLSSSFEQRPTQAQLQAAATSYTKQNRLGVPAVSWDVKLALLAQSSGYEDVAFLEQIYLGDTVGVYFYRLGVDAKARVNKIVWDCLLERYDSVALGSVKANIASTIAGQQREIDAKPSVSLVEQISSGLAAALLGANGGSVRLLDANGDGEPDELYIADNSDPIKAKEVWRFNYKGWAASEKGYNGPFKMGATFTGGIQAWMVTAANLVAGTISSEQGNFLINLDGGTIDTSATGATYKNSNYSQADLDRINQINIKAVTPTLADYEKLDVNGDGTISITDTVQIQQIISGARTVNFTTRWRLRIDPADGNSLLKIYRVYHNNITGADTENIVFSVGFGRAAANTIGAQYGEIEKDLSVGGSVDASNYKQDGKTVTFPTQKVIGYVVYCTGGSGNQAGCFIPAGQSGSYQCASNDWYCAFNFDGAGSATKTGGTGDISRVSTVNNF
jgi:phage minor structural protein